MTDGRKRLAAAALLFGGLALALGTPVFVVRTMPNLEGYLMHPAVLGVQAVPYLLCAVFWLPRRAPFGTTGALVFAVLLFVAAIVSYGPMIVNPAALAGDMVALAFFAVSAITSGVLLLATALVALTWKVSTLIRRRRAASLQGDGTSSHPAS